MICISLEAKRGKDNDGETMQQASSDGAGSRGTGNEYTRNARIYEKRSY